MPRRNRTPRHEPYIDTNTCKDKRKFSTEKEAKTAAELRELTTNSAYSVYKCDRCAGWHLTTRKSSKD